MSKKVLKLTLFIFLILFGIFMFIYGGYDDSPGAQLLGMAAAIGGVVGIIKTVRKK